jgi:hypothetical protein
MIDVDVVEPGRSLPHSRLARTRLADLHLGPTKNLGTSGGMDLNGVWHVDARNGLTAPLSAAGVDVRPILIVFGQAQILLQPTSIFLVAPLHPWLLTEIE